MHCESRVLIKEDEDQRIIHAQQDIRLVISRHFHTSNDGIAICEKICLQILINSHIQYAFH
jgi:hypothetical protein